MAYCRSGIKSSSGYQDVRGDKSNRSIALDHPSYPPVLVKLLKFTSLNMFKYRHDAELSRTISNFYLALSAVPLKMQRKVHSIKAIRNSELTSYRFDVKTIPRSESDRFAVDRRIVIMKPVKRNI